MVQAKTYKTSEEYADAEAKQRANMRMPDAKYCGWPTGLVIDGLDDELKEIIIDYKKEAMKDALETFD